MIGRNSVDILSEFKPKKLYLTQTPWLFCWLICKKLECWVALNFSIVWFFISSSMPRLVRIWKHASLSDPEVEFKTELNDAERHISSIVHWKDLISWKLYRLHVTAANPTATYGLTYKLTFRNIDPTWSNQLQPQHILEPTQATGLGALRASWTKTELCNLCGLCFVLSRNIQNLRKQANHQFIVWTNLKMPVGQSCSTKAGRLVLPHAQLVPRWNDAIRPHCLHLPGPHSSDANNA